MIVRAEALSPEQKSVIEQILGRPILEAEAISLRAFAQPTVAAAERHAAAGELRRFLEKADGPRTGVSDEEVEAALLEAIRSERPGYTRALRGSFSIAISWCDPSQNRMDWRASCSCSFWQAVTRWFSSTSCFPKCPACFTIPADGNCGGSSTGLRPLCATGAGLMPRAPRAARIGCADGL